MILGWDLQKRVFSWKRLVAIYIVGVSAFFSLQKVPFYLNKFVSSSNVDPLALSIYICSFLSLYRTRCNNYLYRSICYLLQFFPCYFFSLLSYTLGTASRAFLSRNDWLATLQENWTRRKAWKRNNARQRPRKDEEKGDKTMVKWTAIVATYINVKHIKSRLANTTPSSNIMKGCSKTAQPK